MTGSIGFTKRQLEPPRASSRDDKVGKAGRPLKVEVNFLPMTIKVPGGTVYHYDCDFKFPWKREVRKSTEEIKRTTVKVFAGYYMACALHITIDFLRENLMLVMQC